MMASPLLISGDVRSMSAFNLNTYSNVDVIRVDQDVLGKQGERLVGGPFTSMAYLSACIAGDPAQLFERGSAASGTEGFIMSAPTAATAAGDGAAAGDVTDGGGSLPAALCLKARGCQSDPIFGPCAIGGTPTCGGNTSLPHPDQRYSLDAQTAQLQSFDDADLAADAPSCMEVSVFPYMILKPCASNGPFPVPVAQQWSFDEAPGAKGKTKGGANGEANGETQGNPITVKHRGSGACLTRGGLSTTNVWGRHLHGGDYALLFVNVGAVATDVTCGTACWAATGLASGKTFTVKDLWNKTAPADARSTAEPFTVHGVQPDGGVAMFRLTPEMK
jgi:hypothetical protein